MDIKRMDGAVLLLLQNILNNVKTKGNIKFS